MESTRIWKEFEKLYPKVFDLDRAMVTVELSVNAALKEEISVKSGDNFVTVCGKTLSDLFCGIYCFFEQCGMQFQITGPVFGGIEKLTEIPAISMSTSASVKQRGIRMHLNFVQDQSFFCEEDFKSFIENMGRMKMNYLLFHMYNGQEWFPFVYRGREHLELELGNLGRKMLPAGMIGREKVKTEEIWYPKEFENITDVRELRDAVMKRYQNMMKEAKELGIRLAASFEPEVISESFEEDILKWSMEEQKEKEKAYNLTTDWQEGWSGKKLAEVSTLNPILKDMAVERALALFEAYPLLDELHLISREGTSFLADTRGEYILELKRLEDSLGIRFEEDFIEKLFGKNEEEGMINPKAYPYWTVLPGQSYIGSFLGAIRYLEFAAEILKDERLTKLSERTGLKFCISLYSPNPGTISLVNQIAGNILPENVRFDILGDYGAKDICGQLDVWKPLLCRHPNTGMISWLEFDGNMDLAQGWTKAIYDNVVKASELGISTIYFNQWRLHSLEQNAYLAAQTCFDAAESYDSIMGRYLEKLYGRKQIPLGLLAYETLEEATDYCKNNHYNIGFTNDWVYQHSTDTPGYRWQDLHHSQKLFELAGEYFSRIAGDAKGQGAEHASYMRDWCIMSFFHLKAVEHLQKSKLPLMGYGCFPVEQEGSWPSPQELAVLVHESYLALRYENEYMNTFAPWVSGSDEQGQLAHHQLGTIEPLKHHHEVLKARYEESISRMIGE